jgi:hypothetical protein
MPLIYIQAKHFPKEISALLREVSIPYLALLNLVKHLLFGFTLEWRLTKEHDVGDNAEGPQVDLGSVSFPLHDLGRHVERGSQVLGETWPFRVKTSCKSKVSYFYLKTFLDKNIFGLDVSVNNIF